MAHNARAAVRSATATPTVTHGSQTILDTHVEPSVPSATLTLRGVPDQPPRVRWAEDVVDNEGMGKKSSKVCCIYHKPPEPGDSEPESDSSSDDGSDDESDLSRARKASDNKGRRRRHDHDHARDHGGEGDGSGKCGARRASPNAYERQPKHKDKKEG